MPPVPAIHPPDSLTVLGPPPDCHFVDRDANGRVQAQCSLWWRRPQSPAEPVTGLIGKYAADSEAAGLAVLAQATAEAETHGCTRLIGPVDGSTWGRYRFVTSGFQDPPFFLEPHQPPSWPGHFTTAGFVPWARYESTVVEHRNPVDSIDVRAGMGGLSADMTIRSLAMADIEEELRAIHRISLAAFALAPLYEPIDFDAFASRHTALLPRLVPEFVLMAERAGQVIGFLFAIPDFLQSQGGGRIDTVIIKTVAVMPGRAQAGLGIALVRRLHAVANEHGHGRVIHALMHEANTSRNILRLHARQMRQYTLFAKSL